MITAEQLNAGNTARKAFSIAIKDQIVAIDTKIRSVEPKFGINTVVHDLPIVFNILGVDKCTTQKIIYASIIKSFKERGFEVKLLLEEDKSILFVRWRIEIPGSELESINSTIVESRISREDIDSMFPGDIVGGRAHSPPQQKQNKKRSADKTVFALNM